MANVSVLQITQDTIPGSPATVTTPAGTNRYMLFFLHSRNSNASVPLIFGSVSYGTKPMEFIARSDYVAGLNTNLEIWALKEADIPSGTNDITYTTISGTPQQDRGATIFFGNVNQTTPIYQIQSNYGLTGQPVPLDIEVLTGGMAFGGVTFNSNQTPTWNNGWTQQYAVNMATSAHKTAGSITTTGIQTMDVDGNGTVDFAQVLLSITSEDGGIPVISISGIPTLRNTSSVTVTGNNFGLATPTVQLGGFNQSVSSFTQTSVTFTVARNINRFGAIDLKVIRSNPTQEDLKPTTILPQTGWDYIDLSGTLAVAGDRITAVGDIVAGNQLAWGNVQGTGVITVGTNGVQILQNGSFIADSWVTAFTVECHDGIDWGTTGVQTLSSTSGAGTGAGLKLDLNLVV